MAERTYPPDRQNGSADTVLYVIGAALLLLLGLGGGGAAMATIARRRRPGDPPMVAAAASEFEPKSEADTLLAGLDLDAELERVLAQEQSADTQAGPESADPTELAPTPR